MEFSEQIRELRKENHLTQEEMAARDPSGCIQLGKREESS